MRSIKSGRISLILLLFILTGPMLTWSTEEYASQTEKNCTYCHVDPDEGPELTEEGKIFAAGLEKKGLIRTTSKSGRVFKYILIYIHIITAFIWFGSIFYIHIFLKPSYVAKGIPPNELKLGWVSMISMLFTGIILTWMKIPTFSALFKTRFGILLSIKLSLFILLVLTIIFVTFYVAPRLNKRIRGKVSTVPGNKTSEELEKYDGRDERPGYFSYSGKIYDVTKSRLWKNGTHLKQHRAGMDLTDALKHAPHGEEIFSALPVIGNLITGNTRPKSPFYIKAFYFLVYFVLVIIFTVVFIISIWKR